MRPEHLEQVDDPAELSRGPVEAHGSISPSSGVVGLVGSDAESAAGALFKKINGKRRWAVRLLEIVLGAIAKRCKPEVAPCTGQVAHVLVFEPGSLGDITMLLPFFKSLRRALPEARIVLVCRSGRAGFLGNYAKINHSSIETLVKKQGLVDELIDVTVPWVRSVASWKRHNPLSMGWLKFIWQLTRLRKKGFDLAFATGRTDIRYNFALWLTGATRRVGYGYAGGACLLTEIVTPDMSRPHQSDLALRLLEHLSIPSIYSGNLLTVSSAERKTALQFLWDHDVKPGEFVVGIHPGSRVPARTWGSDNFREVARQLVRNFHVKVVWFSEPGDETAPLSDPKIVPAALPLPEFLAVLSACHFLVCNDSGPMHMSWALGVPVVAIFGSTFPEWFRPPGPLHRVVTRRDVPCRPCGDRCLYDQPYCLRLIPVEQVMTEVRAMMDSLQFQRRVQGS